MAIRSVIEVGLEGDDRFKRFAELFSKYQDQLAKSRPAWNSVRADIQVSAQAFDRMSAALLANTELQSRLAREQKAAAQQTQAQSRSFRDIYRTTAGIAQHIKAATLDFLKWSGAVAAFSGLLGAGGLFGIERLAQSAAGTRRQAMGFNETPGEVQAWNIDYGQFVNPGMAQQGIFQMLHDPQYRQYLTAMGVSQQVQGTNDPFQIFSAMLPGLYKQLQGVQEPFLVPWMQQRGLDKVMTPDMAEMIKRMSPQEIVYWEQHAAQDAGRGPPLQVLNDWTKLHAQLQRAGTEIENVLITGLVKLSGPIANLSQAFINLVQAFMQSPTVAHWIDIIAKALNDFAKFISTPKFAADVQNLTAQVGKIGDDLFQFGKTVLDWITWFNSVSHGGSIGQSLFGPTFEGHPYGPSSGPPGASTQYQGPGAPNQPGVATQTLQGMKQFDELYMKTMPGVLKNWWDWGKGIFNNWYHPQSYTAPQATSGLIHPAGFQTVADQSGGGGNNPWENLLYSVMMQESGGNPNALSKAGAEGLFQFMPATAARYGINPWDPQQALQGASHYLSDLMGEFHGDIAEALAGYNWGEQNVEADIRQHGQNWMAYAPAETQNYVASILKRMMALQISQGGVNRITINNQTGGNISYSSSQLVGA